MGSMEHMPRTSGLPWWPAPFLGTLLVTMLVLARRRSGKWFAPTVTLGFVFLAGCGGNPLAPPSTGIAPGRYQLTVTATSGNLTHSTQVTLVVE